MDAPVVWTRGRVAGVAGVDPGDAVSVPVLLRDGVVIVTRPDVDR